MISLMKGNQCTVKYEVPQQWQQYVFLWRSLRFRKTTSTPKRDYSLFQIWVFVDFTFTSSNIVKHCHKSSALIFGKRSSLFYLFVSVSFFFADCAFFVTRDSCLKNESLVLSLFLECVSLSPETYIVFGPSSRIPGSHQQQLLTLF